MSYRMTALNKNTIIIIACLSKNKNKKLVGVWREWLSYCEIEMDACMSKPRWLYLGHCVYISWKHDIVHVYNINMLEWSIICLVAYKFIEIQSVLNALYEEIIKQASGGSNPGESRICCSLYSQRAYRISVGLKSKDDKWKEGNGSEYYLSFRKHLLMLCVVSTANPEERGYMTEISSSVFRGTDFEHMLISLSSFLKVSICLRAFMNHSCSNRNSYHH